MRVCLSLCFAFLLGNARAQVNYATSLIPDSLRTHAHSVIREYQETFVVSSVSKATFTAHEVVTILDPQGKRDLAFSVRSSAFFKLEDADIFVYDSTGHAYRHIRQKDMNKSSWGEEFVEDGIVTYYSVDDDTYPITIEKDYTQDYKGTMFFPEFDMSNAEGSIQHGSMTVTMPKDMPLRYHGHHTQLQPTIAEPDKDNRTYTWTISGVKATPSEGGAPADWRPVVYLGPTQFAMAGITGDMSTWQSFGKWTYDLNKDALVLPEASKQFYRDMVKNASTDLDKARILYTYLQKNFRYVSIQLGIGGWKAFPASFTEKKKFGDCKALSSYLCACLDAVGVKSYTALINSGELSQPVDPAFPFDRFNHVILCIPQPHDSVWLECTSNHTDFGVLGSFTENRNALLLTENGGVLVHTPSATAGETTTTSFTHVTLSEDGSGKADITMRATGEDRFREIGALYEQNHDDQKRYLVDYLEYPQPDDFTVVQEQIDSPALHTQMTMAFEKVPDFTAGDKMFLRPQLYHLSLGRLPEEKHRTQPYYFPNPYQKTDTT
jgi:hypothetical protein